MTKESNIKLTPEQLIQTYMLGIFPMSDGRNNNKIYFVIEHLVFIGNYRATFLNSIHLDFNHQQNVVRFDPN